MVCFVRGSRSCALDRDRPAESTHHAIAVYLCLFFDLKHEIRVSPLFISCQKSQFIKSSPTTIFALDPNINTGSETILILEAFEICAEADFLLIDFIN